MDSEKVKGTVKWGAIIAGIVAVVTLGLRQLGCEEAADVIDSVIPAKQAPAEPEAQQPADQQ